MKIVDNKITEATRQELWDYWYKRELYYEIDWHSYFAQMRLVGVKIIE